MYMRVCLDAIIDSITRALDFFSAISKLLGLCNKQNLHFPSGVSMHPVYTDPGSPAYSILYPALTAEHTSLLFFMLPSTTSMVPQPLQLQR